MKHEVFDMQMRELNEDGVFETLVLEAQDTLWRVLDMTPEQRERAKPDLDEALAFLSRARKECP